MEHYILGIFVGAFVALIFLFFAKAAKKREEFDERQLKLRGDAFKYGFFTLMLTEASYGFLVAVVLERPLMEDGVSAVAGIFLGLVVFASYCVWNDAFFNATQRPVPYLILTSAVCVIQATSAVRALREGLLFRDGLITFSILPFFAFGAFFIILCVILLKLAISRHEESDDE